MADNDTSPIDPLASFDQQPQGDTPLAQEDVSIYENTDPVDEDMIITSDEPMEPQTTEEESLFKTTEPQSFSSLGDEQADISEYQDAKTDTDPAVQKMRNEISLEDRIVKLHAISKFALAIVILVCLVFVADGFAKGSASGSPLLRLPFFVQDNILCNRINGGFDLSGLLGDNTFLASSGNQDFKSEYDAGKCFSREELSVIYEQRREYLDEETGKALSAVLPKKFSFVSFSESPLFRFIQSQAPDRRAGHAQLITDILAQVDKVDATTDMTLLCQRITFEDKVATVSCLARGRADVSSRDVVLVFLDALKRQPSMYIINHPDSIELRQLDDESGYETESAIDLHIIQRTSGFETSVIPNVD